MNKLQKIVEAYPEASFVKADGFDDAVVGVCVTTLRLIYSMQKCIQILKNEMSHDEAVEYFWHNLEGFKTDMGEPIWIEEF